MKRETEIKNFLIFGEPRLTDIHALTALLEVPGILRFFISTPGCDTNVYKNFVDLSERRRKAGEIITVATGDCLSGGAILVAAGSPGKRMMTKHAILGLHFPFLTRVTQDPVAQQNEVESLEIEKEIYLQLLEKFSNKTRAF